MSASHPDVINELESRELISRLAGGEALRAHLTGDRRGVYCGFDPTAESLHIGHLVPLLALRRFQLAGHRPIPLVGGATGLIGDPSFKNAERALNPMDTIESWVESIKPQLGQFLDFDSKINPAILVNNLDWTRDYGVLGFLRDIGKHFPVNAMIQKESVRRRLEREGEGISYTEFSYMVLQSYDFSQLYRHYGCTLQIGGSDQWGNITGGIDLTRRLYGAQVYGATLPLITRTDGSKFGKTSRGAIWMDAAKTSPYAFYQFWLNTADADVYRFLKYFTFLTVDQIGAIEADDRASNGKPGAQGILAREVTELVHGAAGRQAATRISEALFSGELGHLTAQDLQQLELDGLPCTELGGDKLDIVGVLVATGLAKSNRIARELIGNNAVSVNGRVVNTPDFELSAGNAMEDRYFVLKRGKKMFHLGKLANR